MGEVAEKGSEARILKVGVRVIAADALIGIHLFPARNQLLNLEILAPHQSWAHPLPFPLRVALHSIRPIAFPPLQSRASSPGSGRQEATFVGPFGNCIAARRVRMGFGLHSGGGTIAGIRICSCANPCAKMPQER
jgi:hypothetical protein